VGPSVSLVYGVVRPCGSSGQRNQGPLRPGYRCRWKRSTTGRPGTPGSWRFRAVFDSLADGSNVVYTAVGWSGSTPRRATPAEPPGTISLNQVRDNRPPTSTFSGEGSCDPSPDPDPALRPRRATHSKRSRTRSQYSSSNCCRPIPNFSSNEVAKTAPLPASIITSRTRLFGCPRPSASRRYRMESSKRA
jgi:hypothetical protein